MSEHANTREKRLAALAVAVVVLVTVLLIVETFRLLLPGLWSAFSAGDEQALKEAVKESVTQLSGRGASLQKYQIFITELIAEIFRFGTLNGLNLDEIFSGTGDIYREVLQMESPEALENWLLKTGRQMQEMIQNGRQDTTK